ncbi:MAG: hypothetical protein JNM13_01005 [Hyphomicrobiaceae bacterium]|nr:hypothetical protein [Hyphomicrobiaceae bacterium]
MTLPIVAPGSQLQTFRVGDKSVRLTFRREAATGGLLIGKAPAAAVEIVALVHNLCAAAHRGAARAALRLDPVPLDTRANAAELAAAHLMHLLVFTRATLGLAAVAPPVRLGDLARLLTPTTDAARAEARRLRLWLAGEPGGFDPDNADTALPAADTPVRALLAAVAAIETMTDGPVQPSSPRDWFCRVAGLDAIASARAVGLGAVGLRLYGRMIEAVRALDALADDRDLEAFAPRAPAPGLGEAPAARGLLRHRAEIADGVVAAYAVDTPTAAMFAGELAAFLARLGGDDDRLIRLAIQTFDPCVPHRVDIEASEGACRHA